MIDSKVGGHITGYGNFGNRHVVHKDGAVVIIGYGIELQNDRFACVSGKGDFCFREGTWIESFTAIVGSKRLQISKRCSIICRNLDGEITTSCMVGVVECEFVRAFGGQCNDG